MLTGQILLTALNRTKRMVRVVALDGSHRDLSAAEVIGIVRDSEEYVGHGTKRKCGLVKRVGAQSRKADPVWAMSWRTFRGAAVLPPSPEWFAAVSGR